VSEKEDREWRTVQGIQKKISIQEKWDLLAAISQGPVWDKHPNHSNLLKSFQP